MYVTDEFKSDLSDLIYQIGQANAEQGFHKRGDDLRNRLEWVAKHGVDVSAAKASLADYYGNRMLLVVSEIIEAQDELRHGHDVHEVYYTHPKDDTVVLHRDADGTWRNEVGVPQTDVVLAKPEGVLSEMVDAAIRLLDWAAETEQADAFVNMLFEKLAFNASRAKMHGGKSF